MAQKHFVLVHGAAHGAWSWFKIPPLLEAGGHKVTTLDMSASGINKKDIDEVHTFHDYNLPLLEFMNSLPPGEKVILVGHSLGGLNISLASEKFPHKVSVSVFLGAIMPDTVHSPSYAIDQYAERTPGEYWMDTQFYVSSGKEILVFGHQNLATKLYQLCSPEDIALGKMLVRPSSMFREDLSKQEKLTEDGFGSVKRVYIVIAKHDLAVLEEFQYWQIENTGVSEIKVIKQADHMAMLSSPHEVSQCLLEIANDYH
ncbi:esterase [Lithospermum erythrorhizon]|uniref:Esterase n=1 Tax=Lithospermum erythrorhizon TaxID=34254 RepID=A0AAV3QE85_LITER